MTIQKKILLLLLFILQSCASFQPTPRTFENRVDSLLNSDFFKSTQAGISIYDLTDNKSLLKQNEKFLFRPASNQKILTTSAAYLFLGKDYNFQTSIYHTGEIQDSVCKGDVYFVGGFDPDFASRDLDSMTLQTKKYGIKKIEGNLYADVSAMDSLFWGEGWMWDDDPASYEAYLTPLCINKNSVIVVSQPDEIGKPVNIDLIPKTNYLQIKNLSHTIDSGKTTFSVTRDWLNRRNTIIANGTFLKSAKSDTTILNVFNPPFYFLNLAKESFERNGIIITGRLDTLTLQGEAKKIFLLERNLEKVIKQTNKNSDNLSAEMILRALALKFFNKPATAGKGIILIDSLITRIGLNPKNYRLADGSGLSSYNLISSQLLIEILKYFYFNQPELFSILYDSFPISGYDGTLAGRMKSSMAYKQVHAKTGTISGVSSLSGYLQSKNKHLIAFSILIQNFTGSAGKARAIQDKLCEIIIEMN